MRIVAVAFVLGLMTGVAFAADLTDPVWVQAPDRADWAKAYPAHAAQSGLSGAVKLRCAASAEGSLRNCAVIEEAPAGEGFGAAALMLSGGMQLRPTAQDGEPVGGHSVVVPVRFDPSLLKAAVTITEPDWLQKPSAADLMKFMSDGGFRSRGRVLINCSVTNRGLLQKCAVASETPVGQGYGDISLAMAAGFAMRPMTVDGLPVGGADVHIPINFMASGGARQFYPPSFYSDASTLNRTPRWSAAPTADEMAAAFPRGAIGTVPSALVVLRCRVGVAGRMEGCAALIETPQGRGFAMAAWKLAKDFRLTVGSSTAAAIGSEVEIPFDFRNPSAPSPTLEISDPLWLTGPSDGDSARYFPSAALKAGVKSGSVTLDCAVKRDGALADCAVGTEDPANLGFGDAALKIAGRLQMNPWTRQGEPVEGAKISVPIRLAPPEQSPTPPKP